MFTVALLLAVSAQVQNPGFESAALSGWQTQVYGPASDQPALRLDSSAPKEGRQSLLIEAPRAGRAAVSQTMFLEPGSLWRLRVWVKTDASQPGGIAEIRTPGGSLGDTAALPPSGQWVEREALFRVPSPGEVSIRLQNFARGAKPGSGKVWFDDVRLDGIPDPEPGEIRIRFQKLSRLPIDLKQEGQFIEHLCRLVPSMIAQQVDRDSFEEEPPWKVHYKAETDKPSRPWYPDGAVHVAQYSLDTDRPFNGKRSQKIVLPLAHTRAGIAQDGFYLKKGTGYRLRLNLRGQGNVPVWATLRGHGAVVAGPLLLARATQEWRPAGVMLRPNRDVESATLAIEFEGPGTVWLDRVYLIADDAVLGIWRPDVVAALKDLNPGVVRFGGSSIEGFEWDQAIGPWDNRAPFTTLWGGLEPNFVGIEEFVQLCQHAGAEPLICIRWTGKTPADAAAQVEYLNGAADTRWGKVRAQNGHAAPYRVKYWQIGNEVGGPGYDASVREFAAAMRAVDPAIKILSAFPSAETLQAGGGSIDYLCPHHYECLDLAGKRADFEMLAKQIEEHGAGKTVRVAVTEWNTTAGAFGLGRGMLQTLGNALGCGRYHNLLQRFADLVEIAVRSNLADSFGSGILVPGPGWLYLSPTYHAQKLYSRAAGTYPVAVERDSSLPWQLQEPDVSATASQDGAVLRLYSVNSTARTVPVQFRLEDFPARAWQGSAYILQDREQRLDSEAMNGPDDPGRLTVTARPMEVREDRFEVRFAPYTLTLLELSRRP